MNQNNHIIGVVKELQWHSNEIMKRIINMDDSISPPLKETKTENLKLIKTSININITMD